jgi:hypothetical protein
VDLMDFDVSLLLSVSVGLCLIGAFMLKNASAFLAMSREDRLRFLDGPAREPGDW